MAISEKKKTNVSTKKLDKKEKKETIKNPKVASSVKKMTKTSVKKEEKTPKKENIKIQDLGFKDDETIYTDDEYEQIRNSIGMYISYHGVKAARHLFKEIFNNALDECVNPESPADKVEVYFNETTKEIVISDNGRGLKFDDMYGFITKKHFSTKIGRTLKVDTAGENGVGLKITAALSDKFIATSYRGMESKTVQVIDGKAVEGPIKKEKKFRTGLVVDFIPSEKYLCETREDKLDLKVEDLDEWLRQMSYIIPKGIKMKLVGEKRGSDLAILRNYSRQGLPADVAFLSQVPEFEPVYINAKSDEESTEFFLECAFTYDRTIDNDLIDSYCNYIHTIENGTHVDACESAICAFLTKEAKRLDPNHKYPILYEDCRKGLVLAVNCTARAPQLSGQTKEKVTSEVIRSDGRKAISEALSQYFIENQASLRAIIKYLRDIAKIRMEANKIKGIDTKRTSNWVEDGEIPEYYPLANRNSKGYKELFLTEGDSAAAAIEEVRDRTHQAIFRLLGVVENTYEVPLHKAMKNKTLQNLVKVLGCGIGPNFNIANLKWDKIIIFTDADTDGSYITSLLCTFFATHMPDIILEERLYKAVPPLYLLKATKGKNYYKNIEVLYDKREYYNLFNHIVADNMDLLHVYENGATRQMTKKDKLNWMEMNINYLFHLNNLARRTATPPEIVEKICWNILLSNGSEKRFKTLIEKEFPEMTYSMQDQNLLGSYHEQYVSIIIDALFMKIAQKFIKLLAKNESFKMGMRNINEKDSEYELSTIGGVLNAVNHQYGIDVDQRFKGVGEVEGPLLFRTTINPKLRKLYKLTVSDIPTALETVELLHGRRTTEERKDLLYAREYTLEDIDN